MRLNKASIHCIKQNKPKRKYTITYSNHYKHECNIHEFRVQQDH